MHILENDKLRISLTPYAAAIHEIFDKREKMTLNLVLDREEDHLDDPSYAGNTVGAYAGRIVNSYLLIDGVRYELDSNDGSNSLHGGIFSLRRKWDCAALSKTSVSYETALTHLEDGLPGNRRFRVDYRLDADSLFITISAVSDEKTYFNLTNHTYWAFSENGDMRNALLMIPSEKVVLNDVNHIPMKMISPYGTVLDFNKAHMVGKLDESDPLSFSKGLNNHYYLSGPMDIMDERHHVTICTDASTAVLYMGGYLEHPFRGFAIEPEGEVLFGNSVEGKLCEKRCIRYIFR